jgi:hypothetical protein
MVLFVYFRPCINYWYYVTYNVDVVRHLERYGVRALLYDTAGELGTGLQLWGAVIATRDLYMLDYFAPKGKYMLPASCWLFSFLPCPSILEYGGDMYLRNIGWLSADYTWYPREDMSAEVQHILNLYPID